LITASLSKDCYANIGKVVDTLPPSEPEQNNIEHVAQSVLDRWHFTSGKIILLTSIIQLLAD